MDSGNARISAFLRLFGLGGFAFQRIQPDVDSGWDGAGMRPGGGNGGDGDRVGFEDTTHTCASSCLFQKATHTALARAWTDGLRGVSAAVAAETRLLECFRVRVWLI